MAGTDSTIATLRDRVMPLLREKIPADKAKWTPRADVARDAKTVVADFLVKSGLELNLLDQRDLVTSLVNNFMADNTATAPAPAMVAALAEASISSSTSLEQPPDTPAPEPLARNSSRASVDMAKAKLQTLVLERIDTSAAAKLPRADLSRDLTGLVAELLAENRIQLNAAERTDLVKQLLDDMLGLGPL